MNSLTCLQYNTYNFQAERHGLSTVYISTLKPCNVSYMHTKKHDDLTEHSKVFDNINFSGFLLERCHPPFFCRRKVGVQRAALSPSEKGQSFHGPQGPPKKRNSHQIFVFLRLKNRNRKSVKNPEFLGGCENIGYPETWLKLLEDSLLDPISNVSGCTSWLRMNGSVLLADPWGESFDDFFSGPKKKVLPKKGEESFNKKKMVSD